MPITHASEIQEKPSAKPDANEPEPIHFAKVFGKSAFKAGIEDPYNGLQQLINVGSEQAGLGNILPEMKISKEQQNVQFGSSDWYAQTIGSGLGMVLPFILAERGVGKFATAQRLSKLEALGGVAAKVEPLIKPALSGAAYGFIFTPSEGTDSFFQQRSVNAAVGALTFTTQRVATQGLMGRLSAAGLTLTEATFQKSISGHLTRIGSNAFGGSIAGVVNAESNSLLSGNGLASREQVLQGAAAFAVTGGALDLARIGSGALKGKTTRLESREGATRVETANSGVVIDSQKDLLNIANTLIEAKFDKPAAAQQKQQFEKLVSAVAAREHIDEVGTAGKHLARTFDAVKRLLSAPSEQVDAITSFALAKQILSETANINSIHTGKNNTAEAKGVQILLADRVPGHLADAIVDLATTGKYQTNRSPAIAVDLSASKLATLPQQYRDTLLPDAEARQTLKQSLNSQDLAPEVTENPRSYASQLAQILLGNIKVQGEKSNSVYVKSTSDHAANGDTGERLLRANEKGNYEPVIEQDKPAQGARLQTTDVQPLFDHISGVNNDSLVIKNGNTYVITDTEGRIRSAERTSRFGIYNNDQRFLSNFDIRLNGVEPKFERASVDKAYAARFEYTNSEAPQLAANSVKVTRDLVINADKVTERLDLKNTTDRPQSVQLRVGYGADFADMFEVRGMVRAEHGTSSEPIISANSKNIRLSHKGLDGQTVQTDIGLTPHANPIKVEGGSANLTLLLPPQSHRGIEFSFKPTIGKSDLSQAERSSSFSSELKQADKSYDQWRKSGTQITTDNPKFNAALERAFKDLYMLNIDTPEGGGIAAGIPWYVSAFGRDQLITSMQTLPYQPQLTKSVLVQLAKYQGSEDVAATAEKPGKIMHELRTGELARNKEIPFTPYYGTVDATPLWLMLLGRYVKQTGDLKLARELAPNINRALEYLDKETEHNGYLNYGGKGAEALSNQGWKDSGNSISDAQGRNVKGPIALAEVQGYLYSAWSEAAKIFALEGNVKRATELENKAAKLKERFNKDFWMPEENFAAMALDGDMNQASSIGSNAGHLLKTALLTPDHAFAVADRLMQTDMYSGYGIRTLSANAPNYNPGSYHNGTVWPHDNGMISEGIHDLMPRSGYSERILADTLTVAQKFPGSRLPELFAGFSSKENVEPILYPEQSSPQAWAAGTLPQLLTSNLSIHPNAAKNELLIFKPSLPAALGEVTVTGYSVGAAKVDLKFTNKNNQTTMTVLSNPNKVNIVYVPN